MRGAPLGRAGGVVGSRAQQRVPELDVAVGDRDQASSLGGGEVVHRQLDLAQGRLDRRDPAGVRAGGEQQRTALTVGEPVERAPERPLDAGAGAQRLLERLAPRALAVRQQPRDLQQRERVARRRLHEPVGDRRRHALDLRGGQQLARLGLAERLDPQQLQPRHLEPGDGGALAQRADHRDALGAEPAAGEQERLQRRLVEPLRVVDRHQHRLLLGGDGEQAQQPGRDREAIVRRGRPERQRAAQRACLDLGDVVEPVEQRRDELGQPGERDVGLGLDAAGAQHAQPGRLADRPSHQRGLADPGLAVHEQRAALAGASLRQQPVNPCPLAFASYEHRRSLWGQTP